MSSPELVSAVAGGPRPITGSLKWWRRLSEWPMFRKVLIANSALMAAGAMVGTSLTLRACHAMRIPEPAAAGLFALIAVSISVVINWLLLRAAFQPLDMLASIVREVRKGNFSARPRSVPFPDPEIQRAAETLTETLDAVERYRAQLADLSVAILTAQEKERLRIARDLHDDTAQALTAVLLQLKLVSGRLELAQDRQALDQTRQQVLEALEGVHRLSLNLRPPSLEEMGLIAALQSRVDDLRTLAGLQVDFHHPVVVPRLPPEEELALYRVAQEALTNVVKHARAGTASINLRLSLATLELSVVDDGVGFDAVRTNGRGRLGLFGMSERMAMIGASFRIESAPGQGTRVHVSLPLANR